jgi:hypothetical protein
VTTDNKERLRELNTRLGVKTHVKKNREGGGTRVPQAKVDFVMIKENRVLKLEAELHRIRKWLQEIVNRYSRAGYPDKGKVFQNAINHIDKVLKE